VKTKSLISFLIFLVVSLFFTLISCKNESEQYELDPDLFPKSEESSDSSDEPDETITYASSRLMSVDSESEGLKVHLNYSTSQYPYFKLFIENENTNKKFYYTCNLSDAQNDIVFIPVSKDSIYSVKLYVYNTEEKFIKEIPTDNYDTIRSINAVGGTGEYTFTSPAYNAKASYNDSTRSLTFNTASSNDQSYDSQQTFDLYVYSLTPMPPQDGHDDLTAQTIHEKYPNIKVLTESDNTYDVSQILQDYCVANNKDSIQFGLIEKLQFRKAGETDYLYEVWYNDTVFAHHKPYTYTKK